MPLPLLAPLVVTAAAAATAGWAGARWWQRVFGGAGRLADPAAGRDGGTPQPTTHPRARARTMTWCATCGAYVLPDHAASGAHADRHGGG